MALHKRLVIVTTTHALISCYSNMQAVIINYLQPVLTPFVNQSFYAHYGTVLQPAQFSWLWSLIASMSFVGIVIGGASIGPSLERIGRRDTSMLLRNGAAILGLACAILARPLNAWELLAIGHLLCGVSLALQSTLLVYIGECVADRYRGAVSLMTGVSVQLWVVIASVLSLPNLLGNDRLWPYFPCVCAVPAVLHLAFGWWLPRSPKYLYINRRERARSIESVKFFHGDAVETETVLGEYDREAAIAKTSGKSSGSRLSPKEIWAQRHLRLPFLVCLVAAVSPVFGGLPIRSQYSALMLQTYGVDKDNVMIFIIVLNSIFLPINIASPLLSEKIGRRPLFLSCIACGLISVLLMFCGEQLTNYGDIQPLTSSGVGFAGFILGTLSSSLGFIQIPQLLTAELCPQATRATASAAGALIAIFASLIVVFTFLPMDTAIGAYSYLPMAFLETLCLVFMWKYLPETKNQAVDEIVKKFMRGERSADTISEEQPLLFDD